MGLNTSFSMYNCKGFLHVGRGDRNEDFEVKCGEYTV